MTDTLEHLRLLEGYAVYRPVGQVTFQEAIGMMARAIGFCHDHGIGKLFIDSTGLTGIAVPTIGDRFDLGEQSARAARGAVKVAIVARPELIDPNQFGILVARNRGLRAGAFTKEADAVRWLLESETG